MDDEEIFNKSFITSGYENVANFFLMNFFLKKEI